MAGLHPIWTSKNKKVIVVTDEMCNQGEREVIVEFEGRRLRCAPGVSLAAVLADAGVLALREANDGDLRGLFCGMGVCQECRMDVDGQSGVRACMTVVNESLRVSRQGRSPKAHTESGSCIASGEPIVEEPDVLVVGAGAAGLTAAAVAAESGAEVVVLDERAKAGGQYYKQPLSYKQVPESLAGDRQFDDGRLLIERAQRSGATLIQGAEVWGAFAPSGEGLGSPGRRDLAPRAAGCPIGMADTDAGHGRNSEAALDTPFPVG